MIVTVQNVEKEASVNAVSDVLVGRIWITRMVLFWFQVGFGLLIILVLLVLMIKSHARISLNDSKVLKIIQEELENEGYDNFELESITSLDKPHITSVIVNANHQEIGLEVDYKTCKILSREKIDR